MTNKPVQVEASNPAEDRDTVIARLRAQRVSMMNARRKLEVKPIPGYYLHWCLEKNLQECLAAGYQHVKRGEVSLGPLVTGNPWGDGGTDMGDNISMIGDKTESGTPVRLYLIKLYQELHDDDMREKDKIDAAKLQTIFGDEAIIGADGQIETKSQHMYKKALFQRPARKAKIISPRP